ncbi:hypothetical protein NL676_037417 [Syzygium grande]|nr:hypothetical protein NL676_037417 [Syzygium grande]
MEPRNGKYKFSTTELRPGDSKAVPKGRKTVPNHHQRQNLARRGYACLYKQLGTVLYSPLLNLITALKMVATDRPRDGLPVSRLFDGGGQFNS